MAVGAADALMLVRPTIDVSLFTHAIDPQLDFWQRELGARLEEVLQVRPGQVQYRHALASSFVKLGWLQAPMPALPPCGIRELLLASPGMLSPRERVDPDGNRVTLLPPGVDGVSQIGLRIAVRDLAAGAAFYGGVLGLPLAKTPDGIRVHAGESVLLLGEERDATVDPPLRGPGWRFLSLQVRDARRAHAEVLARGGRDGVAPQRLGDVARFAFVRDPDGNWIELSQRASLTGPLGED